MPIRTEPDIVAPLLPRVGYTIGPKGANTFLNRDVLEVTREGGLITIGSGDAMLPMDLDRAENLAQTILRLLDSYPVAAPGEAVNA